MKERRTTMAALDWSLEYLKDIKRNMLHGDQKKQELAWAVGGIVVALESHLLMSCAEVLKDSVTRDGAKAKDDLIAIKSRMLEFFDKMLAQ